MSEKTTRSLLASQPQVIAIGNFDGVHKGHQHLISAARKLADAQNMPLTILTFSPHPRTVLMPHLPHTQIMTDDEKKPALLETGADKIHTLPFTLKTAAMSPEDFVQNILITTLNAKHIFIGENFRYGHKAKGTPQILSENTYFTTHIISLLADENGPYSSTRLRQK